MTYWPNFMVEIGGSTDLGPYYVMSGDFRPQSVISGMNRLKQEITGDCNIIHAHSWVPDSSGRYRSSYVNC